MAADPKQAHPITCSCGEHAPEKPGALEGLLDDCPKNGHEAGYIWVSHAEAVGEWFLSNEPALRAALRAADRPAPDMEYVKKRYHEAVARQRELENTSQWSKPYYVMVQDRDLAEAELWTAVERLASAPPTRGKP